ncbi:coiled-coil domain-containing protein 73-like [Mugil cephalus]|uniref:coiled-coil domain-containing protein 73-like n=1 Tax=Mugil cephalus TaxID=48193 RepID=UPI001FB75C3A|nr:coiled-coil domain-containing protein 73-like [Mugil cephalus]XP_047452662.1 coiled-coil domain-containing protein 73-like [Mugil cephalus]XP_047452663.1 coiled-coil domain-containing protein 73-like [Mugil cephalus]XP_047452664.1 coiled-coil domain-containing protein 73-like [Mugil cephalus]XP_047452665.1 coiled-coil domain-containing protein 73-like [Mugil cephalus]
MALSSDSGILPTHTSSRESASEEEPSLSNTHGQTESGGTVILQLLEFKSHLLEAVEELHIRRDAETRFEDQISKLVLEKQELEWEKESLQHQIETVSNQHTESLASFKKQFQAKLRNSEEEKGKYQVTAELKDKEINNLKEELKSLQLLKYNLEKRSSELEQKLALQSRSKDSHLNQLGEVEKRFSALSRQCTVIKQAHEKLEQNADEAMRINKKLTSVNEKQGATIVSLTKELDEVKNKLVKVKMASVRYEKTQSPPGREIEIQQLQHRLKMETEMNKKLREENESERAEKKEMMRSLQKTQQLLLSQTQTVRRGEQELQTQRQMYQALKQEHEVMREKSKATEDEVAQLKESFAVSQTSWDKERMTFRDRVKSEQEEREAVKEAFDDLHQKHSELSLQAKSQAQHINELEMRVNHHSVPTKPFDENRCEETLNDPISIPSVLQDPDSLQHSVSSETKNLEGLDGTDAETELVATGAIGEQEVLDHHELVLNHSDMLISLVITNDNNNNHHPISLSGPTADIFDKNSDGDVTNPISSVSDDGVQIRRVSSKSVSITSSGPNSNPPDGCVDFKTSEGNRGMNEAEQRLEDDGRRQENGQEEMSRDEVQGEGVKEKRSVGEERESDRRNRREESEGSAKVVEETSNPETEDRADGQDSDGGETKTQIPTQTEKSNALQVVDFMHTEIPLSVCEPKPSSQSLSQTQQDAGFEKEDSGPSSAAQEGQHLYHDEVQTFYGDAEAVGHQSSPVCEVFEKQADKREPPELRIQSSPCASQINTAPLSYQCGGVVGVQEWEKTSQTETRNPSANVKETSEMCEEHASGDEIESKRPQSQKTSEQESGELAITDGAQSDDACKSGSTHIGTSCLKDVCVDTTEGSVDLESEVETRQDHVKADETEDTTTARSHPSHERDESSETSSSKCLSPAGSSLACKKPYRSLFGWGTAQRQTLSSRAKPDVSFQASPFMFEQTTPGSGGVLGNPPSTKFPKSNRNKVPLVVIRASDLLNASGVSGTSSKRCQQGEREAEGAADTDDRSSWSISSFPVSTAPECRRVPTSAAGASSESDCEPPCFSQEGEDQQSSLRAQISKIEQFLNAERLHLPKRRRTDN